MNKAQIVNLLHTATEKHVVGEPKNGESKAGRSKHTVKLTIGDTDLWVTAYGKVDPIPPTPTVKGKAKGKAEVDLNAMLDQMAKMQAALLALAK